VRLGATRLTAVSSPRRRRSLAEQMAAIYAAGRIGPTYDLLQPETMFTTRAMTTQCATPGAGAAVFVGGLLDVSRGLALGPELVTNGDFSAGIGEPWAAINDAGGSVALVDGAANITNAGGTARLGQMIAFVSGKSYVIKFTVSGANLTVYSGTDNTVLIAVTPGTYRITHLATASSNTLNFRNFANGTTAILDNVSVQELEGYHALAANDSTARPQLSGRVNQLLATATLSTQNVTTTAQDYILSFAGAGSIALSGTGSGTYNAGTHTVTCTAGTLTVTVTGSVLTADLRSASGGVGLPAYQAVVSAESYTDIGYRELIGNGTGTDMRTASYAPGSDAVTVAFGVRKSSDAALGIVAEHTASLASNNGAWNATAPNGASADMAFNSKGTAATDAVAGSLTAPLTRTFMGQGSISGDYSRIYINGVLVDTDAGDQGTGNYATAITYLFSRGGAGSWLNGAIVGRLAIAYGPELSESERTTFDGWVNEAARAY
jgi:hypothetical protein